MNDSLLIPKVVFLALACANSGLAQTPLPPPETPHEKLAAILQGAVDRHEVAGGVMVVADKDKTLDVDTVGLADIAANKPMREDTLFWIASQSKPIAATALMMLVDVGKVHLEDPVAKYLPEFKGQMVVAEHDENHTLLKKPEHPVCIWNLLSHTAGLPFASSIETPTLDRLPLATAVRSYAMLNLQTEPGSKFAYANAGINTIGRVIEVVSGMPYEQFLQQRLFEPLGMKDTTFWPTEEQVARIAKSYRREAPPSTTLEEIQVTQLKYPLSDRVTRFPVPAGGLFSTAADLTHFCQMILNHGELDGRRYLSEAAVQKMTTRETGDRVQDPYGFGWFVNDGLISHSGAYATDMTINPHNGLIELFFVQLAGYTNDIGNTRKAFQKAADEQFGRPPTP